MIAIFSRARRRLTLLAQTPEFSGVSSFPAANNTDSRSKGPWPNGVYDVDRLIEVGGFDSDEDGKFGRWFLLVKDFDERTGMGIHAGRVGKPDGLGREGFEHATYGCIRTTPDAMKFIAHMHTLDPLTQIWVKD